MRDVTGTAANKAGIATRNDLALHDLTGGNSWISGILASADQSSAAYDSYNYAILSGTKYSGAKIDVAGLQGYGQALLDGKARAEQQLKMAANLIVVSDTSGGVVLRIQNNAGHKLLSGFPEGRRMWLNVKFYDSAGQILSGQINPYDPLVISIDSGGNAQYVSGGILNKWREDLVYEAEMSSSLTGENKTFHFVLASSRFKDNRIPPKGFQIAQAAARIVVPRWEGVDASNYFTSAEYSGGYDEVTISKPADTAQWSAALYYQTTSKEYIDFLRNEIAGTANTLSSPTPSGEPNAYIVQTDPFFANLKSWDKAIWDLWLHNGGAPPVLMTSVGSTPTACNAPGIPLNLMASGGKRNATLQWGSVSGATGYKVYYSQSGKYTIRTTTGSTSYIDSGLKS
ncbi:MAG: hypothetical protein L0287_07370, partial [Anaerolineae bacterium]|nr:hypothetical protein [Anaerolineae bacterium]